MNSCKVSALSSDNAAALRASMVLIRKSLIAPMVLMVPMKFQVRVIPWWAPASFGKDFRLQRVKLQLA